jgi:hypothetical protein
VGVFHRRSLPADLESVVTELLDCSKHRLEMLG